jgi:hypothetical protein
LNLRDATREVGNYREAEAKAQQQLLNEFVAAEQQEARAAEAAEQERQQAQPAQQHGEAAAGAHQQPQQQPQQPDERAVLQAQLQAEREWHALDSEEKKASQAVRDWLNYARHYFPELASNEAVEHARVNNPARYQQLLAAHNKMAPQIDAWMQRGRQATEARQVRQHQLSTHQQALLQHKYSEFSKQNDEAFSRVAPEMNDPAQARVLRDAARASLKSVGFHDEELQAAWQGQTGVPLRDHRVQQIIRKAALYDQAVARSKEIQRAPIPPVQKPGAYRSQGAGSMETVQNLQRQLAEATGDKAIRIAARLTQAQRRL